MRSAVSLLSTALGVSTQLVSQLMEIRLPTHTRRTFARSEMDGAASCRCGCSPEQREDSRSGPDSRAREQRAPAHSDCSHPIVSRA